MNCWVFSCSAFFILLNNLAATQFVVPWLQQNDAAAAKIVEGPSSQSVVPGATAVFRCSVAKADLAQRILWAYLDHGLVLSVNRTLLVLDTRYKILDAPQDAASTHFDLQVSNITSDDAGTYSCQVISGNGNKLIQTAVLTVNGSTTSVLPSVGIQSTLVFERQECCRRMNVSLSCQKLCSGQSTWSAYDIVSSVQCMNYLGTFVYCASDQRNHIPCCIRRFVAPDCLDFCAPPSSSNLAGFGLGRVASLSLRCFPQLSSITRCMEEGQHTIPDPPRGLSLTPLSPTSILARWLPPSTTGFYTEAQMRYRVFIAQSDSDDIELTGNDFQITPGLTNDTQMLITGLVPSTRYAVYVTAVSPHGSSAPSFIADIFTPPDSKPTESDRASVVDCCSRYKVSSDCSNLFCTPRNTPEQLQNLTSGNTAYTCADAVQPAFGCLSGKLDHQRCCKSRRVPANCLGFCSPDAPPFGLEHASCLRYIGLMNACFLEGKQLFPGAPSNFTVANVTATSAIFDWSPPVTNPKLVVRYKVLVKPASVISDDSGLWQAIPTMIPGMVVNGLDPDEQYIASLWAESASGPGLISMLDFATLPVSVSNSTSGQPDMGSCCSMLGVKSECMRFCNVDVFANATAAASSDPVLFYSCLNADFHKVLACAADGRNHSLCCARQGIPAPCLRVCAVSPQFRDIGRDQAMCVSFSQTIVQCLREGWSSIPKPPRSLDVYNITAHSAVLSWRPPLADSPDYASFIISSWTGPPENRIEAEYPVAINLRGPVYAQNVTGLVARARYTFRVFAVNSAGRSLAANEISVITAGDDIVNGTQLPTTTPIPFSKWTNNMSACCASLRLSSACATACLDVRALNSTYCPDDIPQLISCWSAVDSSQGTDKGLSDCCATSNVPSQCLQMCQPAAAQMKSIPRACISSVPLILACYQRRFSSIPSPPRRFSVVSTGALSAILRWLPPSRNSEALASYTLFYYPEPNSTDVRSVPNVTAVTPSVYPTNIDDSDDPSDISSVIDPGMMTFTLGDLRPSSMYRTWLVAISKVGGVSLPTPEVTFSTSRESLYVTMVLAPGEYATSGKSFSMLCSPQFAYTNITWWYAPPGEYGNILSVRSGLMASSMLAASANTPPPRQQIPTPAVKPNNITFNPVMANASGQYTCRVMSNFTKTYYEATRFVKVMTTPAAVQSFRKITLPTRYYATVPINCSFTGYPVSFRWFQGSVPFRSFPRTTFTGNLSVSTIQVLASSMESTVFTCNASNVFGSATCEVAVDFVGPSSPTATPVLLPWFSPKPNQLNKEPVVSVDIASLAAMVDGDCCSAAVREMDGCQCAHQTPVASRSFSIPTRCLEAMSKCARSESLPSAVRDLKVSIGPYSSNASWIPPQKINYLSRFRISYSSPLDPRSPLVDYAEVVSEESNSFWSTRTQTTEIARFIHGRSGLIPDISYKLTVESLNIYNFTDKLNGVATLDVASRTPYSSENLPTIAVSVSRSASVLANIQWSIQTPPSSSLLLTDSPYNQIEVCYRPAPTPPNSADDTSTLPTSDKFFRVKADQKGRQISIGLNASMDYYVIVLAMLTFQNSPLVIASSPMLLAGSGGLGDIYSPAMFAGENNPRFSSMRSLAIGFGIALMALVLILLGVGIFLVVKWRRRHIDQMRHVPLSRTVSFENRARASPGTSGSGEGETNSGYDAISSPDAAAVKISDNQANRSQFEMSSANVF